MTEIERSGRRPTTRNCARERRTSSFQINYVLTLSAIRMKNWPGDTFNTACTQVKEAKETAKVQVKEAKETAEVQVKEAKESRKREGKRGSTKKSSKYIRHII